MERYTERAGCEFGITVRVAIHGRLGSAHRDARPCRDASSARSDGPERRFFFITSNASNVANRAALLDVGLQMLLLGDGSSGRLTALRGRDSGGRSGRRARHI